MQLTYNGIEFDERRSSTFHYATTPVYTEDNMVVKWIHVEIGVATVFSLDNLIADSSFTRALGNAATSSASAIMAVLQGFLLQPRQLLILQEPYGQHGNGFAPDNLIISPQVQGNGQIAAGQVADESGGPRTRCEVSLFTQRSILVNFFVETDVPPCLFSYNANFSAITNRWGWKVSYDRNGIATRRIEGVLSVSKRTDTNPDIYRPLIVPSIPSGFVRQNHSYEVQMDGLALRYSFEDVQQYCDGPGVTDSGGEVIMIS